MHLGDEVLSAVRERREQANTWDGLRCEHELLAAGLASNVRSNAPVTDALVHLALMRFDGDDSRSVGQAPLELDSWAPTVSLVRLKSAVVSVSSATSMRLFCASISA